ncbi:MAG: hypothetical protein LBI35_01900 [Burkholderiales bacterium]|nr:hypothetical protein [Burkholderiales bacterium]
MVLVRLGSKHSFTGVQYAMTSAAPKKTDAVVQKPYDTAEVNHGSRINTIDKSVIGTHEYNASARPHRLKKKKPSIPTKAMMRTATEYNAPSHDIDFPELSISS